MHGLIDGAVGIAADGRDSRNVTERQPAGDATCRSTAAAIEDNRLCVKWSVRSKVL
jgi:hypothetical protein